jgi:uncharacterized protein YfaS (alpha-2-macroglobulin family)
VLDLQGSLGQESLRESIYLPLRPPAPRQEISQGGFFEPGKSVEIKVPATWIQGTGKLHLTLASQPTLQFGANLEYLLNYPYGCVEQTTSTSFPLLYLEDIFSLTRQGETKRKVGPYVEAGIRRLSLMQTSSGGLAMWPGGTTAYPWGTAYAAHFLTEAHKAGYRVPASLLDGVTKYLQSLVQKVSSGSDPEDVYQREVRAYAAYVLALSGKLAPALISHLGENSARLTPTERCFVAAAFQLLGKRETASALLSGKLKFQERDRDTGFGLHSRVRDEAIYLTVLLEVDPDSSEIPVLVESLTASSQSGGWATTHENGYALLALGKYASGFRAAENLTLTGIVQEGGVERLRFADTREARLTLERDRETVLFLTTQGSGRWFYCWRSEGIPEKLDFPVIAQGLDVQRKLLDTEGKPLEKNSLRQGDLVWVEITLQGKHAYQNIVVQELLPSGLEAENPRLTPAVGFSWLGETAPLKPEYLDVRDDRIEFFVNLPDAGVHKLYYGMRAVSPGRFFVSPVQASCMYHPFLKAQSGSGRLEVK